MMGMICNIDSYLLRTRDNGSHVVGWPRELGHPDRAYQEWRIEEREFQYYTSAGT